MASLRFRRLRLVTTRSPAKVFGLQEILAEQSREAEAEAEAEDLQLSEYLRSNEGLDLDTLFARAIAQIEPEDESEGFRQALAPIGGPS